MRTHDFVDGYLRETAEIAARTDRAEIVAIIDLLFEAYRAGAHIYTCGNGGSAANASHLASDLAKFTHVPGKPRFRVSSLCDNAALISALTNDVGFGKIFSDQLEATFSAGDVLICLSVHGGSGEDKAGPWSQNLVAAADLMKKRGGKVVGLVGYDGGAFFSQDGTQLVFRASRPVTDSAKAEYRALLDEGLVAPTDMEIYTCNVDGTNLRKITALGKANWAPYFHPSQKKIIFSSNHASKRGYDFQLYMINLDGTGLERITTESIFNAFPMFSPDGKQLVWSSNRNNGGTRDTNVFIADWTD